MNATCMFCNRALGANEVVETFPVGRRLAFDAERGRLWVVCNKCERWNLTPVEERWEAVETCERLFRETRIRSSTTNVGLARHAEGLELVRIGAPGDGAGVEPRLVRERRRADVRLLGVGREVDELGDVVGDGGEAIEAIRRDGLDAHL